MTNVTPLRAGRFVRPIPAERKARAMNDARAIEHRSEPRKPTMLEELYGFILDIVHNFHVLTVGICIGALGSVGIAALWVAL